jgi:hypothetical protein
MGECALSLVRQEHLGHLVPSFAIGFAPALLDGTALDFVCPFELVIACGVPEQVVDRRRHVVRRRLVDALDALLGVQLIPRAQLQPRDALEVHGDKVQPTRGYVHRQFLSGTSIAPGEE